MEIDYKKRYEDALGWMRDVYPTLTGAAREDAEHYFPELVDNERLRLALVKIVKSIGDKVFSAEDVTKAAVLDYLERQKEEEGVEFIPVESTLEYKLGQKAGREEQKALRWTEDDEQMLKRIVDYIGTVPYFYGVRATEWLERKLKPTVAIMSGRVWTPSQQQKNGLVRAIKLLNDAGDFVEADILESIQRCHNKLCE